jgi:hypothetical protein
VHTYQPLILVAVLKLENQYDIGLTKMGDDHGNGIMFMLGFGAGMFFIWMAMFLYDHIQWVW